MLRSLITLTVTLTVVCPALASKVKVWRHDSPADHAEARLDQAVVTSEGALRLARRIEPLPGVQAAHVWALAEDSQGNLYAATGDQGKLYKVTPSGQVTVAYSSPDSQVLSVTVGRDGTVYAGTGPSGTLVRIPPGGKASVLARDLDSYVWSLVVDPDGTVYAGTGPDGRVYQVTRQGQATAFYTTKQGHVLALARDEAGNLYAGTDRGGLVYRIDPRGKGFVVYSAPQSEVRSLLVTDRGVYAGTSAPGGGGTGGQAVAFGGKMFSSLKEGPGQASSGDTGRGPEGGDDKSKVDTRVVAAKSSAVSRGEEEQEARDPAPSLPAPKSGENSLYLIAPDGTVRELFRDRTMILSTARQRDTLLVGTGMKGQLFQVDEKTRESVELARLDHGQIHCLLQRRDGSVVFGTGDPGKLYTLRPDYAGKATVVSGVLDAKLLSRWGAAAWRAVTPPESAVTVAFRSGNVAVPDETWSDWSAEQADPATAQVDCPPARFLQYRVTLTTDNPRATPEVSGVTVRYVTANHAPEVVTLDVPDLDGEDLEDGKKVQLKWKAIDPNEDELTYSVHVRKDGWDSWVCVEKEVDKSSYDWNTAAMPSGVYRVKVVASDGRDNDRGEALTGQRTSPPFAVSHTPPAVRLKVVAVEGGRATVEATATDPFVRLSRASYAVNGRPQGNVFPADGLFDRRSEAFRFRTERLEPGSHVVVLRVQDAAGNVGMADAVVTVPGPE